LNVKSAEICLEEAAWLDQCFRNGARLEHEWQPLGQHTCSHRRESKESSRAIRTMSQLRQTHTTMKEKRCSV
jgi:hypothetical protein